MSENPKVTEKMMGVEQKRFLASIEKMTTLKKPEIIALAKIYNLGAFFRNNAVRIGEKKMGELIAVIVLGVLKLRAVRAEYKNGILEAAMANPKLAAGLRRGLIDETPVVKGVTCPSPVPGNAVQPKTGVQVATPVVGAKEDSDLKAWTE